MKDLQEIESTKFADYFYILAITIVGLLLRVYNLGYNSLWFDEMYSVPSPEGGISGIFENSESIQRFLIIPTYNLILLPMINILGSSEFIIRLPSALIGSLTIPLSYYLVRNIFDKTSGQIYSGLIALSSYHIFYSREARYYPLLMFLFLLCFLFLYLYIKKGSYGYLLLFIISCVYSIYTHLFAIFAVFTILFYLIICIISSKIYFFNILDAKNIKLYKKGAIISVVAIIIFLTPLYLRYFLSYAGKNHIESKFNWFEILSYLFTSISNFPGEHSVLVVAGAFFFLTALIIYRNNPWAIILFFIFSANSLLTVIILKKAGTFLPEKYLIISYATYMILISISISYILRIFKYSKLRFILVIFTLILYAACNFNSYNRLLFSIYRAQWREVANYLKQRISSDDLIISNNDEKIHTLTFYEPELKDKIRIINAKELTKYNIPNNNLWLISRSYRSSDRSFEEFLNKNCVFLNRFYPLNKILDITINGNMGSPRVFYKIENGEIYSSKNLKLQLEHFEEFNDDDIVNGNYILLKSGKNIKRTISTPVSEIFFNEKQLYEIILKLENALYNVFDLNVDIDNIPCHEFKYRHDLGVLQSFDIISKGSHEIRVSNLSKSDTLIDYIEFRKIYDLIIEQKVAKIYYDEIEFFGHNVIPCCIRRGEHFILETFWKSLKITESNYMITVHIDNLDEETGNFRINADHYPDNGRNLTQYWKSGETIFDRVNIKIPENAPLGKYAVKIGMFENNKKHEYVKIAHIDVLNNYTYYLGKEEYLSRYYKSKDLNLMYENIELTKIYFRIKYISGNRKLDIVAKIIEHTKPENNYKFVGRLEGKKRMHFSILQKGDNSTWKKKRSYYLYYYGDIPNNFEKGEYNLKLWLKYPLYDSYISGMDKNGEMITIITSIVLK